MRLLLLLFRLLNRAAFGTTYPNTALLYCVGFRAC